MAARGERLESLVNSHTPFFDIAARDEAARARIVGALVRSPYTCLALNVLPANSLTVESLLGASGGGRRAVIRERYTSPIVTTNVSLEHFRAATKRRWGAPLERFRRKMKREHQATFHILEQPEHLDLTLERGFWVEGSGWKGAAGTAIRSDPRTEQFYRSVAHRFAARGQLSLSWISFGGEMVAFDLCLLHGQRLYLLKTGFDERYRRLAPGLVLRLSVIERCIERGIAAHELLGDDSEWKRKFADSARRHIEVRLYRRSVSGTMAWAYRRYARPPLRGAYLRLSDRRRRRSE
jgi:hypothetical protein